MPPLMPEPELTAGINLFVEDEAFRVALEFRIKPELVKLKDASRESLRNVQAKIGEMIVAHKWFEDRINRSLEVIEDMRARWERGV